MDIKLPRDADGREIPLDTVALYDDDGNVHSVRRFIYTTNLDLDDKWINSWIAVVDDYKTAKPEQMHLTPTDSWEKLEEDLGRICSNDGEPWFCNYANESTTTRNICQENCKFFYPDDQLSCRNQAVNDIVSRIRKLTAKEG